VTLKASGRRPRSDKLCSSTRPEGHGPSTGPVVFLCGKWIGLRENLQENHHIYWENPMVSGSDFPLNQSIECGKCWKCEEYLTRCSNNSVS
jgi:hypothetical protein